MEKRTYSEKDQSNGNEKDRVDSSQNNRQVKRSRGNNDISQDSCLEETSSIDPSNWAQHTAEGNLSEIISSHVLEKVGMISKEYEQNSKPFRHNVVKDLFVDGFLEKVLHEVKHNFKAKFKESDLFRVYQSIDLGNLDPTNNALSESIPSLMKLRHHLYSQECRHFIEDIACIDRGTLTDEVDCAVNCHNQGCHLLCHDDVIGTRKISYILYLTDPEPDWTDEDGGRLELYDCIEANDEKGKGGRRDEVLNKLNKRKEPGVIPVKTILPTFNTMAYFVVEPGVSFHAVQEVFCDRPRLSIQGWYHANEKPKQMEYASLNQLKTNHNGGCTESFDDNSQIPFSPYKSSKNDFDTKKSNGVKEDEDELSSEDIAFLSTFINETYLKQESIQEIRQRFEEESSVQLRHFFNDQWGAKVKEKLINEDKDQNLGGGRPSLNYSVGLSDDWKIVGPAHKQRYLQYVGDARADGDSCGSILNFLKKQLFQSSQFGRLLMQYSSLGMPLGHKGNVRRFRPGLDYTIAHYGILTTKPVLDATMCFVRGSGKQSLGGEDDDEDDLLWQSDDTGGFECYIAADDEENGEVAADEYDEEDDTKLLSVSASNNTLSLVYRDPGTMRFVKYVGSSAPSSRFDICLEYEVADDDASDDDDKEAASCI